jgi:hypothetical protein
MVNLTTYENRFGAFKKGAKPPLKTGRILCQVTCHVKSFFLPIDESSRVGYYHIGQPTGREQTLFRGGLMNKVPCLRERDAKLSVSASEILNYGLSFWNEG